MREGRAAQFDCSGDLAGVVDGLETVSLVRRGRSGVTEIAHALRRSMTTREAADSQGQYTRADTRWLLPNSECPAGPVLRDTIVDGAGNRWTVLAVVSQDLRGLWECACRDLAIAHGLDDAITLEQAVYTKGSGGAAVANWHTLRTGIRARIQPVTTAVAADAAAQRTVQRYRIVVAEELVVDHTHRIRAADGTIYRIVGSTGAGGIGQLQTIEAEQQ